MLYNLIVHRTEQTAVWELTQGEALKQTPSFIYSPALGCVCANLLITSIVKSILKKM